MFMYTGLTGLLIYHPEVIKGDANNNKLNQPKPVWKQERSLNTAMKQAS